MCGIVGVLGVKNAAGVLVNSLRCLEYRGYDSAGVATLTAGKIDRRRAEGKLNNLAKILDKKPLPGDVGIGHTRWATHGAPSESNAHPHSNGRVAVVHNGIIENFSELRQKLEKKGHKFESDTDTEVVVHLITDYLDRGNKPKDAVAKALKDIHGAFALAILFEGFEDLLIVAKRGSPLAIGYGDVDRKTKKQKMFVGSDALALGPMTDKISYLEEGDWAIITSKGAEIYDEKGKKVKRQIKTIQKKKAATKKGNYRHYMLKEIFEQPSVIGDTLHVYLNPRTRQVNLPHMPFDLDDVDRIMIVACGTSLYAGMVAKYWLETYAQIPVNLDIASEFRYRTPPLEKGTLSIFISQSGETADTLAALRHVKQMKAPTLAVVNVQESTIAREADAMLLTQAGPEIGVASTKAFTTQLIVLATFALELAHLKGTISDKKLKQLSQSLLEVPEQVSAVLKQDRAIQKIAKDISGAKTVLYMGRGGSFPIALEGALKLKEISYIHAEGFAAGEMKHGPIALIDEKVPVVFIAPDDEIFEKTFSNLQEVMARKGRVIALTNGNAAKKFKNMKKANLLTLPKADPFVGPILFTVPIQLLAYHVAVLKGTDVDQPRNLAKSVTVE